MPYIWKPNISVKSTDKFYDFESLSGYVLQFADPEAEEIVLTPDASDEDLGQSVLKSLKQSRDLPREYSWFLQQQVLDKYQAWIQERMKQFGYKSKRALFKDMKNCDINLHKDIIVIEPSKHETLEGWGGTGLKGADYIKLPANSPPEEIGAALRLAFSRCK